MFKKLLFGLGLTLLSLQAAQAQRTCSTMPNLERLEQQYPGTKARLNKLDREIAAQTPQNNVRAAASVITIPVVVHVIYANTTQNISQAQIQSQIDVLNEDYNKQNPDTVNIPAPFKRLAADMQIRFEMANRDPNGNPTNGITRTATTHGAFMDDDAMKFDSLGGKDAWDRSRYLNIWVCNLGWGLLGYAQFPNSGPAATDGVVIGYQYFGRTGTVSRPFNKGRTTTHEVAHWLGLYHIWGDEPACFDDDLVNDTPLQKGENYGCPRYPLVNGAGAACTGFNTNGAMFMNYMDYVDDACMMMFTTGQKNRAHSFLLTVRDSLYFSNGLVISGLREEAAAQAFKLYPNPANGLVKLQPGIGMKGNAAIEITNVLGQVVLRKTVKSQEGETMELNLSGNAPGVYVVRVKTPEKVYDQKLMLTR
jgi:hypothetical protein